MINLRRSCRLAKVCDVLAAVLTLSTVLVTVLPAASVWFSTPCLTPFTMITTYNTHRINLAYQLQEVIKFLPLEYFSQEKWLYISWQVISTHLVYLTETVKEDMMI